MSLPNELLPVGLLGTGAANTGYLIERSLRFNSSDSAYLSRTPASAGNRKTWTWAGWVKRSKITSGDYQFIFGAIDSGATAYTALLYSISDDALSIWDNQAGIPVLRTSQVFRDASAWFHVVWSVDTTQSTASNRMKLYVNGSEVTAWATDARSSITQNLDLAVNRGSWPHSIGSQQPYAGRYFDGYLADIHFIDGQALTPSSFTEVSATTGQLIPKAYSGTFTGNSFWLKFADNSATTATTLGKDSSGLGNNWTPNNLSVTAGVGNDSLVDTPTSSGTDTGVGGVVTGNYCTWNPLDAHSSLTITNGNLDLSNTAGTTRNVRGTIGFPSSGKWYYEVTPGGSAQGAIGVGSSAVPLNAQNAASSVIYFEDGSKGVDANRTAYGSSYASGDVIGIAFNADTNQVTFYKNGVSQGALSTTAGVQYFPFIVTFNATYSANFGQRAFAYPVSGFKALCDTNLPAPLVAKPNTLMDVALYTGNGTNRNITGFGFSPDLVWIKSRSSGTLSHALFDTVRGVNLGLQSNATTAETSDSVSLTAFNSDGFSLGTGNTYFGVNTSSATFVAWAFDAGSNTVSNTAGSITSQVRANASAGFSIVTYTGTLSGNGNATVGHGLGVAPQLVITKARSATSRWAVQMPTALSANNYLELNTTAAQSSWGTQTRANPTSTVFDTIYAGGVNESGVTYVAYCFAPVAGYSSFGSYTGNGSATDGPFVFTGFRPRWVLIKNTGAGGNVWVIYDTARDTYNIAGTELYPNLSSAEAAGTAALDIVSNGFKIRTTSGGLNANGAVYIYAAFAENPFQYARAR